MRALPRGVQSGEADSWMEASRDMHNEALLPCSELGCKWKRG
jgi:hypothetical protein